MILAEEDLTDVAGNLIKITFAMSSVDQSYSYPKHTYSQETKVVHSIVSLYFA